MRRFSGIFLLGLLACGLSSCDPQAFTMNIEMRQKSTSGLDLGRKTMAVVYLESPSGVDSVFNASVANGFAEALERDYFAGNTEVGVFRMPKREKADYSSKDTLVNLVMDTGSDVVFLFDTPKFGQVSLSPRESSGIAAADSSQLVYASFPYSINLYVYDSMDKADTVRVFSGSSTARQPIVTGAAVPDRELLGKVWGQVESQGFKTGEFSSRKFMSVWKEEPFTFIYYDTPSAWNDGAQAAYEYRWKDAIDSWMKLLDTTNMSKRSCAEFNIAQACYLLGDYDLASKWLDASDRDMPISLTKTVRQRIKAKQK